MIHDAVEYIRKELEKQLGIQAADIWVGNVHALKEDTNKTGIYLSLVNLEEEKTLKNLSHSIRQNNKPVYLEPPVHLNLFLLFAFDFGNYATSLQRLSETVELFQAKRVFTQANERPDNKFPAGLVKLIFDLHSQDLEQLNHLWSILGGNYLPSALYKVRLVRIQKDQAQDAPEITGIEVGTGNL